jgi:hypothetical protein
MRVRSKWPLAIGLLGIVAVLASECGGATSPGAHDASTDGAGGSGGRSGAGSSSDRSLPKPLAQRDDRGHRHP